MTDMEYMSRVYCATWNLDNDNGDLYIQGIQEALHTLSEREQLALELRYREGMTYKMVGQNIGGVCTERARYIIQMAMRKLRHLSPSICMSVSQIVEKCDNLRSMLKEKNAVIDEQKKTIMDQKAKIEEQNAMMEAMKNENRKPVSSLQNLMKETQRKDVSIAKKDFESTPFNIVEIPFSSRTYNALVAEGIFKCGEICAYTSFNELSCIPNIGRAALIDIAQKMYCFGFRNWVNTALIHTKGILRDMIQRELE
jgi:sigma-70, region 4